MKHEQIAKSLAETELFSSVKETTVMKLAERAFTKRFRKNEIVFHEGDPGEVLFAVAEGAIKIFITSEDGSEMVLRSVDEHETFGELALVDLGPRSASAAALKPTTLIGVRRETFVELLGQDPGLSQALHRSLGDLFRRQLAQASDLVFLDLPGRLAKLLLSLSAEGDTVDLPLSQGDLARMVGGSRPTVNQILKSFAERGYIELEGRRVRLKDPTSLRRRAGL